MSREPANTTLPLVLNVATSSAPASSNSAFSRSFVTRRFLPRFTARRNAAYLMLRTGWQSRPATGRSRVVHGRFTGFGAPDPTLQACRSLAGCSSSPWSPATSWDASSRERRLYPETLVYAATAAFGLDFLIASWRSLWARVREPELALFASAGGALDSASWKHAGPMFSRPRHGCSSRTCWTGSHACTRWSRWLIFVPGDRCRCSWSARAASPPRSRSIGLVLGGYVFWTLTEYWLHRLDLPLRARGGHRSPSSTGSSTASITTTRTTRSGS